tara:strand:+ start:107 stop:529 length:423 start_codon:yes stop_codon:yes gene_type:complete
MQLDKYQAVLDGIGLLSKGDTHSKYTPQEVHTYLLLPINYNRIRLYYDKGKPVGLVTWCWLPPTTSQLFLEDQYELKEEDYAKENPDGHELWGIEFITPYGHASKVMRLIRKEHKELYGTTTKVNFRRFYDRNRIHTRTF